MNKGKPDSSWPLIFKILKYVYWIVGLVVLLGGCYFLYNNLARPVAAMLIFMFGILALYFYYTKWFLIDLIKPAWPPYQTLCPDYLTPVTPGYSTNKDGSLKPKEGGVIKCVDFIGVSKNGKLKKSVPETMNKTLNNPDYFVPINPSASRESLKTMLRTYGLTWVSMFGDNV